MQSKDDDALPEGWTKRESTSQPGRYYYVSPTGQTQWYPPRKAAAAAAPKAFNWRCEIEIEFGAGRLGVGLKEVPQTTSIPFPMFQAEVEELPKLPGGKPGPAEIYNWSVKPDKRLYPGMRLTQINGFVLAGCKYTEVVDKLKKADRPVKLKFADAARGVFDKDEAMPEAETEAPKMAPALAYPPMSAFSVQKQKKEEYMQLLVSSELSTEMWQLETQKIQSQHRQVALKWDLLSKSFNALMEQQLKCKKEIEVATYEQSKYTEMLEQLKQQESGAVVSPEVLKTQELSAKNAELSQDINAMSAGNKKLRKEREANQKLLDELEAQVTAEALKTATNAPAPAKLSVDDWCGIDPALSPRRKLELYAQKMALLEYELKKEEQRAKQAETELAGLSRAYCEESDIAMDTMRGSIPRPSEEVSPARPTLKSIDEDLPPPPSSSAVMPPILMGSTRTGLHSQRSERTRSGSSNGAAVLKRAESTRSTKSDAPMTGSSRNLTRATSTTPASMTPPQLAREGFLEKFPTHFNQEGGMFKSMRIMRGARERWCVLTPQGTLLYYKKRGDATPRAEIPLNDSSLEVVCDALVNNYSAKSTKELTFTISTTLAQNKFQAASLEELRSWVTAIRQVHAFWMSSGHEAKEDQALQRLVDEEQQQRTQHRRAVEF
ncbi:hypothetical protein SPRG_01213 [Saprolegnia parasitica CBS 223.65]|uniref:WW domain-containing protein n=1 Tax=Saprolegnia parasitica (strain CBS 223.65) TaxID=695850 RepID=A0A067D944_SAPPC|nr:hypothetical protein SPRG_01213 [Saprolegnia parasitica CBS 223.65]KDO35146.1 hypothetical protein SPRG_01213 [Saprolegnia parasitica CBS 223.65]|eukprot:XP_012194794.1 hypothetical protein SPRG_01213 [Saprolegnia parasitica CBS 223.65]